MNFKNPFIHNLNEKDINTFTSNMGMFLRRKLDKPFKILCNLFTKADIIRPLFFPELTDEAYWEGLDTMPVPLHAKKGKNNIVLERYPKLNNDEPYIFVCNHTCPKDIETLLNVLDRNAYVVLGSVELIKYEPEMYLLWLNGMISFDIINPAERKGLMSKMERVLKTNSILIFPEGSHNYHPSNLINPLFDGPVNLALQTGRKIIPTTLVKDRDTEISYIDVGNPVDVRELNIPHTDNEKEYVHALTAAIRDKMATAVYHIIARHIAPIRRNEHVNILQEYQSLYTQEAFNALKWRHDVFEAEYLVKKTAADRDYEEVLETLSNLRLDIQTLRQSNLDSREYILKKMALDQENTAGFLRAHWKKIYD